MQPTEDNLIQYIEALKSYTPSVRMRAAKALGQIGVASAIPTLIEALKDSDRDIRRYAAEALVKFGDTHTLPLRILSTPLLTPAEKWHTLEELRGIRPTAEFNLHYTLPDILIYCQRHSTYREANDGVRTGANAVIEYRMGLSVSVGDTTPSFHIPDQNVQPLDAPTKQQDTLKTE